MFLFIEVSNILVKGSVWLMSYTRKIRMEYFEVACRYVNDKAHTPDAAFDLNLWIAKAGKLSLEARTFDYYQEQARLDKFWFNEQSKYWFLNFIRLRETNIPTTAKIDAESVPLELADDEYIGEEVNALYDDKLSVLMLQRNKFSLGVNGIEEYLNLVWNSNNEKIYLRPICPLDLQEKAAKAPEYRKFTIRFADMKNQAVDSDSPRMFNKLFDNLKKYKAVNAEITVSMAHNQGDALDTETVRETIKDIVGNKNMVSKAEVSVKYMEDTKVEVIDLFEDKLHDFIFVPLEKRVSLASEFVESYMIARYNESKGNIINSIRVRSNGE